VQNCTTKSCNLPANHLKLTKRECRWSLAYKRCSSHLRKNRGMGSFLEEMHFFLPSEKVFDPSVVFRVIQHVADGRRIPLAATLAGDTLVVQFFVRWTSAIIHLSACQRSAAPRRSLRPPRSGRLPDRVHTRNDWRVGHFSCTKAR
jgi:hypothetical protein